MTTAGTYEEFCKVCVCCDDFPVYEEKALRMATTMPQLGNMQTDTNPALLLAAIMFHASTKVITALLDNGADPHLHDRTIGSAIHFACAAQHVGAASAILKRHPDCAKLMGGRGKTPLEIAKELGPPEMVSLIEKCIADHP
jgi:ankyrin repeat protein